MAVAGADADSLPSTVRQPALPVRVLDPGREFVCTLEEGEDAPSLIPQQVCAPLLPEAVAEAQSETAPRRATRNSISTGASGVRGLFRSFSYFSSMDTQLRGLCAHLMIWLKYYLF